MRSRGLARLMLYPIAVVWRTWDSFRSHMATNEARRAHLAQGHAMPAVTRNIHCDGRAIQPDEPEPVPNARLLVTVLDPAGDATRALWANLAAEGLARAYGEDEPEYGLPKAHSTGGSQ